MEQYEINDFNEHLIKDLSGKKIQLYHFVVEPYPPHEFIVTLAKWLKGVTIIPHDKLPITAIPTHNTPEGNLNWCPVTTIEPDRDLYIKIEKPDYITQTKLPMKILYKIIE